MISTQRERVRALRRDTGMCVLLLGIAAAVFAFAQNRGWIVGGAIAFPKLLWLSYALFSWFLLPPMLARDGRASESTRRLYRVFFWNMAARGVAELVMIYGWHNWHPAYGIAHDLFSIGLLLWFAFQVKRERPIDRVLVLHTLVLAVTFAAEISFAVYFATHFVTHGEKALYFVPNEQRYSGILVRTSIAVSCLTLYFPWFLYRWLYALDESGSNTNSGLRHE